MGSYLRIKGADFSVNALASIGYILPDGYTLLEWLESDGTQGVVSNYHANATSKFEIDMTLTALSGSSSPNGPIFTTRSSAEDTSPRLQANFGNATYYYRIYCHTKLNDTSHYIGTTTSTILSNRKLTVDVPGKVASFGGVNTTLATTDFVPVEQPVKFLLSPSNIKLSTFKAKIYYIKIYESGSLVRYYVPVAHNNGNGFYDYLTGHYMADIDGNAFTAPTE